MHYYYAERATEKKLHEYNLMNFNVIIIINYAQCPVFPLVFDYGNIF